MKTFQVAKIKTGRLQGEKKLLFFFSPCNRHNIDLNFLASRANKLIQAEKSIEKNVHVNYRPRFQEQPMISYFSSTQALICIYRRIISIYH